MKYLILVFFLSCFAVGYFLPITQDEAYYWIWSKYLDFGYLDHPPLVAFQIYLSNFFSSIRFINIISAAITAFILTKIYEKVSTNKESTFKASILGIFNWGLLLLGVLTTPDSLMVLMWVYSLWLILGLIDGKKNNWIALAICCVLGCLSKYTMVLILPVIFLSLPFKKQFFPLSKIFQGFLLGIVLSIPHFYWQLKNNFITIDFQLNHGLATKNLNFNMINLQNYLLTLILFFGAFLAVLPFGFFGKRKSPSIKEKYKKVLRYGFLVPFIFFFWVSLKNKVEANWAAFSILALPPLLAHWLQRIPIRVFKILAFLNVGILFFLTLHAKTPVDFYDYKDRVLKETWGYESLANFVNQYEGTIFADNYQNTAMLSYYLQKRIKDIAQKEGISRPSEFTRRIEMIPKHDATKPMWLVKNGFSKPNDLKLGTIFFYLKDCPKEGFIIAKDLEDESLKCNSPHEWSFWEIARSL